MLLGQQVKEDHFSQSPSNRTDCSSSPALDAWQPSPARLLQEERRGKVNAGPTAIPELKNTCTFSSERTSSPSFSLDSPAPVQSMPVQHPPSTIHHSQTNTHITPSHPNHSQRHPTPSASRMHPIPSHQSPLAATPLLVETPEKNKLLPSPSAEQRPGTPHQIV